MKSSLSVIAVFIAAACAYGAHAQTEDIKYEAPPRVSPDRVLGPALLRSGNHRVREEVRTRATWLEFEIESDFGSYKALSIPMVAVRVHEIRTLAQAVDQFRRNNQQLAESLRGKLEVGADSFVDILTSPLSTSSQIVKQFRVNVARTFEELREGSPEAAEKSADERSIYDGFEPGDPILASHKRNVASQLDLDFYSSNPRVQEFLDTVAAARGAGRVSAGVVTISLPRGQEFRPAGGRVDASVRAAMTHNTINQLYARNFDRLVSSGVPEELANAFLSHPVLSPSHKTMLTEQVAYLDGVENRGALLRAALSAASEEEALSFVQIGKLLFAYRERSGSLKSVAAAGHMVLAITSDGAIAVMLPLDVLYWNRETREVFSGLQAFARAKGFERHAIISSSIITESAKGGLYALGFELEERYLEAR